MGMWQAIAQGASDIVNLGGQRYAGRYSARAAKKMQERDQKWREDMRATHFQTMVQDLTKAGINPLMSVKGLSTQTPGSSSTGAGGGMNPKVMEGAQVAMMMAQTAKLRSEKELVDNQKDAQEFLATLSKYAGAQLDEFIRNGPAAINDFLQNLGLQFGKSPNKKIPEGYMFSKEQLAPKSRRHGSLEVYGAQRDRRRNLDYYKRRERELSNTLSSREVSESMSDGERIRLWRQLREVRNYLKLMGED